MRFLFLLFLIFISTLKAESNPAVISEPQTAKWAQRWWMPRHESRLEQINQYKGKFDLVFIGDSITQGWEGKAARNALKEDFKGKTILNLGFKGDYTGHVLWRLQNGELKDVEANFAVILIGTNNTTRGDSPEQIAEGIKAVLNLTQKSLPQTKIVLINVLPRSKPGHKFRIANQKINTLIKPLADEKNIHWFDINKLLMNKEGQLHQDLFAKDQLHLRDKGYQVWSKALAQKIKALGK